MNIFIVKIVLRESFKKFGHLIENKFRNTIDGIISKKCEFKFEYPKYLDFDKNTGKLRCFVSEI
ncbi:MAG: hypothetical protein ABF289_18865 [Clostridiales bacterium]